MLIAQDLIWFRLVCWSHRTSCSPHMLIAQDLISFFIFFYLPGLTSECRFGWDLKFFEDFWFNGIYLLSPRRSFWSFYQVWDSFSFCIHISDRETCIWCSMSCDVWLCMNEMLMHWFPFYVFSFHQNLPPSCPYTLCGPVGAVSLPSALGDISVSIRACRIVSYFSFLEIEHSCLIL